MSSRDQAMPLFSSALIAPLADSALLDALLVRRAAHHAFNKNSGRVDVVGVDSAGLDQMFDLRNGDLCGRRHHRVEVARGLPIDEVALAISFPGMDDCEIGDEATLHNVAFPIEAANFLALRHQGADTRLGKKCRYAGSPGPYPFGESTLGIEFEVEGTAQIKIRKELVFAHIRRDHLADLPGLAKHTRPGSVNAAVVRDYGQARHPAASDPSAQSLRN